MLVAENITNPRMAQVICQVGTDPGLRLGDVRFRFNPLADWSMAELQGYVAEHKPPLHPLAEDGYVSIGCLPCTQRINPGEDYRDGR
jgi:phosphoadenosine phosphosulfate reductase